VCSSDLKLPSDRLQALERFYLLSFYLFLPDLPINSI